MQSGSGEHGGRNSSSQKTIKNARRFAPAPSLPGQCPQATGLAVRCWERHAGLMSAFLRTESSTISLSSRDTHHSERVSQFDSAKGFTRPPPPSPLGYLQEVQHVPVAILSQVGPCRGSRLLYGRGGLLRPPGRTSRQPGIQGGTSECGGQALGT